MERRSFAAAALALTACGQATPKSVDARLVIKEVAAEGTPDDWFAVINAGDAEVDLSDFIYVDKAGARDRARTFPSIVLGFGERHVQYVSRAVTGFQLGNDDGLWIYRAHDGVAVAHVDWGKPN